MLLKLLLVWVFVKAANALCEWWNYRNLFGPVVDGQCDVAAQHWDYCSAACDPVRTGPNARSTSMKLTTMLQCKEHQWSGLQVSSTAITVWDGNHKNINTQHHKKEKDEICSKTSNV